MYRCNIISNIKEKINNQEKFDHKLIEFSLTPIMHRSRKKIINQFKQNVDLMNQINYNNKQIRNSTYGIAIMLSNMYFAKDNPMRKEIQGDYMIKVDCVNEALKEGYDTGLDAGKLENIISSTRRYIRSSYIVFFSRTYGPHK